MDNVQEEIIPKGATLIFDIELLKIEDNDEGMIDHIFSNYFHVKGSI